MLKLRDYIGKTFFDILEFGSILSIVTAQRKQKEMHKDVFDIIKIIRKIIYDKQIQLQSKDLYQDFMLQLELNL